ncbi:hypothetical protein V2J09_012817 [Rumex salicifolius]
MKGSLHCWINSRLEAPPQKATSLVILYVFLFMALTLFGSLIVEPLIIFVLPFPCSLLMNPTIKPTINHIGTIQLTPSITLHHVLHVLEFSFNFLSVGCLVRGLQANMFFTPNQCVLQGPSMNTPQVLGSISRSLYLTNTTSHATTLTRQPPIILFFPFEIIKPPHPHHLPGGLQDPTSHRPIFKTTYATSLKLSHNSH